MDAFYLKLRYNPSSLVVFGATSTAVALALAVAVYTVCSSPTYAFLCSSSPVAGPAESDPSGLPTRLADVTLTPLTPYSPRLTRSPPPRERPPPVPPVAVDVGVYMPRSAASMATSIFSSTVSPCYQVVGLTGLKGTDRGVSGRLRLPLPSSGTPSCN